MYKHIFVYVERIRSHSRKHNTDIFWYITHITTVTPTLSYTNLQIQRQPLFTHICVHVNIIHLSPFYCTGKTWKEEVVRHFVRTDYLNIILNYLLTYFHGSVYL